LAEQAMKNILERVGSDTLAEIGHGGVVWQHGVAAQVEKQPMGHVDLRLPHEFTIGPPIMNAQKIEFEHYDRIQRRPSSAERVVFLQRRPKALKIDEALQPPQKMILGHQSSKQLPFKVVERHKNSRLQHNRPTSHVEDILPQSLSPVFQQSHGGEGRKTL